MLLTKIYCLRFNDLPMNLRLIFIEEIMYDEE